MTLTSSRLFGLYHRLDPAGQDVHAGAMMKTLKLVSVIVLGLALPAQVLAQSPAPLDDSRRAYVVEFLTSGAWPDADVIIPDEAPEADPVPDVETLEILDVSPVKSVPGRFLKNANGTPFFLSAAEYVDQRGNAPMQVVQAQYKVERRNAKSGLNTEPKFLSVTLGPDYTSINREDTSRILDFKTNRILGVTPSDSGPVFSNQSLYAAAFSHISLINQQTQKGNQDQVPVSEEKSLDAFWLESGIGWTARDISDRVTVNQDENALTAFYDERAVLNIEFDGPDLPSPDHLNALIGFWHHDLPVHPAIFAKLRPFTKLPSRIEMISYAPKTPDGVASEWTLVEADVKKAGFPLDENVKNIVEIAEVSPLAFVIDQAARGEALGGRPDNRELRDTYQAAMADQDWMIAWVHARYLAERQGGCEKDPALLCDDIAEIESQDDAVSALVAGRKAKSSADQIAALKDILAFHETGKASAYATRIAGELRSKLKTDADPALQAISAAQLLEEALIKNPYDVQTYRSLAKVYAAQGRYAESWDLQDALKFHPDVPETLLSPVKRVEKALRLQAPGYFTR